MVSSNEKAFKLTLRLRENLAGRILLKFGLVGLLALPVALPLLYLIWQAGQANPSELWKTLQRVNLLKIAWQMFSLAFGATTVALLLAGPWAWLVARTDVPGRRFFRWFGPLPLAIPPYVGALAYAALCAKGGILHTFLAGLAGKPTFQYEFPDFFYGYFGSAFVLGVFCAPYVFTNVYAALQRLDPSLEEAARSLGQTRRQVFWQITFPLLRPAILAGSLLVFLYACVDFGVVSLLRYQTFTTLIYNYLLAGFNVQASAAFCLVLVVLVWLVLAAQRRALGQARYVQTKARPAPPLKLGFWKWPAFAFLLLALCLTFILPLGVLLYQITRFRSGEAFANFMLEQVGYAGNTLWLALLSATLITALAVLVARLLWRAPQSRVARLADNILQAGYAIPGTVLGLALASLTLNLLAPLYGTPFVLLLAYLVLYMATGLQASKAALAGLSPTMEEAARALGDNQRTALRRVVLPLAWPGVLGGWLLVFVLSLRELAATIILRPAGFDTLAVRIWVHTTDVGPDPSSSAVALVLVTLAGSFWLLVLFWGTAEKREKREKREKGARREKTEMERKNA